MPGDREVALLDQRALPLVERYDRLERVEQVAVAIETLAVRGAPAIGIAAAYGPVLAAAGARGAPAAFVSSMAAAHVRLKSTRPTAVNLAWALDRMGALVRVVAPLAPGERGARLAAEERGIQREEAEGCWGMGKFGARRIRDGPVILTHCIAGALATGGCGT